jgi:hypothetical protein
LSGLDPDLNVEMLVLALNAKAMIGRLNSFPSRDPHSALGIPRSF